MGDVPVHVSGGFPERELGLFRVGDSGKASCGVSGLVEGGTECLKCFDGVVSATDRDGLCHDNFMKLKAIRIFLDDFSVWYCFEEGSGAFLEPKRAILFPARGGFRAGEGSALVMTDRRNPIRQETQNFRRSSSIL